MATEQFANSAASTLSAGINNSTTSVAVASVSGFPSTGNFRIKVDSEIMLVTSISSLTFTVTRGIEGTTAASHSSAAPVTHVLTAGAVSQLITDNPASLTASFASRPAASKTGRLFLPTNGIILNHDTGSTWKTFGPIYALEPPPAASNWTAVGGPAALVETDYGLYLRNGGASGQNIRGYVKAVPATPYSIECAFLYSIISVDYVQFGFFWYDSGSGKAVTNFLFTNQDNNVTFPCRCVCEKWSSLTAINSNYAFLHGVNNIGLSPMFLNGLLFMRMVDDGTHRSWEVSCDGINWILIQYHNTNDYMTPDKVGFGLDVESTSFAQAMTLVHWKVY